MLSMDRKASCGFISIDCDCDYVDDDCDNIHDAYDENGVDVDILRMYIIYYIYSAGWRRCPAWTGRPTRRRRVSPCSIPWALSEDWIWACSLLNPMLNTMGTF